MKILTSPEKYLSLRPSQLVTLECLNCNNPFERKKTKVEHALKPETGHTLCFCSTTCHDKAACKEDTFQDVECLNCGKPFPKIVSQIRKSPNHFCNKSCAATFNNKKKTTGIKKSKAEIYLCERIQADFPCLLVEENKRNLLPSGLEIDIYIPSHNLAIELNGPVHYLALYGEEKLRLIQNKDILKLEELKELGCTTIIVDISTHKYWKTSKNLLEDFYLNHLKPLLQ